MLQSLVSTCTVSGMEDFIVEIYKCFGLAASSLEVTYDNWVYLQALRTYWVIL